MNNNSIPIDEPSLEPIDEQDSLSFPLDEPSLKSINNTGKLPNQRLKGVVYLSSIPPFMKPIKLRQLLSEYGEIGKIYLAPEDPKITMRRKKYKGNKRQNFTEGWVEFLDKRIAKQVASSLNSNKIGGKKRNFYHDDIWNIRYLSRFKWNNLSEQIAYERAVRDQKLRVEMSTQKKMNKEYLKNVEKAKMVEGIEKRKSERNEEVSEKKQRFVKQRKVVDPNNN